MSQKHASWSEILNQILNALESPGATDSDIGSHIETCPRCERLADEARWILGLFADARLQPPPQALVEKSLEVVRQEFARKAAAAVGQGLRRTLRDMAARSTEVAATLVADSRLPSPALRGGSVEASPRMLLYDTDTYAVTLSVVSRGKEKRCDVMGQVTPKTEVALPEGGWATAEAAGESFEVPLAALGEFRLRGLDPRLDEVSILLGDQHIRLPLPRMKDA